MSDFVFFWKPNEKNGFMSQWYEAEIYIGGIKYINCEQYMMASKAMLFGDKEVYEKIMKEINPAKIKKLGKEVRNFDERKWNLHKYRIILEGNFAKFSQNDDLLSLLFETEDAILAEASPYDRIYGIGMKADNPDVEDTYKWGENLLGSAIMAVRNMFLADEASCRSIL